MSAAPEGERAHALALAGVAVLMTPWCVRAVSELNPLPGWETNPLMAWAPVVGLGPAGSMVCDAASCVGAAMLLIADVLRRRALGERVASRVDWFILAAAMIPAFAVVMHMMVSVRGAMPPGAHARVGASWVSAALGAVAIARYGRGGGAGTSGRAVLGVVLSTVVGLIGAVVLRGGQQVLFEHAALVASFRADPAGVLAAQGWTPGSPMALAFERRLTQSDATGWFGLSNVFASFAAFAGVVGVGGVVACVRPGTGGAPADRRWGVFAGSVLAAVGVAGLVWSDSRGGVMMFAVGIGLIAAARLLAVAARGESRKRTAAAVLGLGVMVGPLALVAVRGVIGERLSELSLLFRWYYIEAAWRIFMDRAWSGVGPAGFQAAYAVAKNPLSPEEVVSPHSIALDWLATLGAVGLLWVCLLVFAAVASARGGLQVDRAAAVHEARPQGRGVLRAAVVIPALATLAGIWLASGFLTPEGAIVRMAGWAVWTAVSVLFLRAFYGSPERWRCPLAAGVLAMIAHAQVEVTMSWPASVGLCTAILACCWCVGVANSGDAPHPARRHGGRGGVWPATAISCACVCIAAMVWSAVGTWAWEGPLREGARVVSPIGVYAQRLSEVARRQGTAEPTADSLERIAEDLRAELASNGTPAAVASIGQLGTTRESWERAIAELDRALIPRAIARMLSGTAAGRPHPVWQVRREISGLWVRLAEGARLRVGWVGGGDPAEERRYLDEARRVLAPAGNGEYRPAALWHAQAMVLVRCAERADAEREGLLEEAREAFQAAQRSDPHNPTIAVGLMRVEVARGDWAGAAAAARRVLAIDRQMRLDVTRQLRAEDRAEAERLAEIAP